MKRFQDYPSVGLIKSLVQENKVNIIFAATENETKFYEGLSKHLVDSQYGILRKESDNILNILKDEYEV